MTPKSPAILDPKAVQEESHRTKALLRLTMACNEKCPFCNVPVEDYEVRTPPFEDVQAELQQIIDAGEQTLTISGGEPTLYRDRLTALCQQAHDGGISFIELQTNAVLVDESYAVELAQAGTTSAFVSLLSHIPALHDELAGLEDAFEPCLRGIDAFLSAGIPVTLNPVIAFQTQTTLPDYVDFVAKRFPAIQSISCSAVQPHGRAAKNLELLPDYGVLADTIRKARDRASHHGIELLNPYCGVPACIGWEDNLSHSVEAFEATRGGFDTVGLQNLGNKRHGPPCIRCALRTRCGGAWHSYWDLRHGSGLEPPIEIKFPWDTTETNPEQQRIVRGGDGLGKAQWEELREGGPYTLWYWTSGLTLQDARLLLETQCTDVAWQINPTALEDEKETLKSIKQLVHWTEKWQPQHRIRVWCGLVLNQTTELGPIARVVNILEKQGATGVVLLTSGEIECTELIEMLRRRCGEIDILSIDGFLSVHTADRIGDCEVGDTLKT